MFSFFLNCRNCLRRIIHDDQDFSNQSIINVIERFVKTVNLMEETILIPSRLMDRQVNNDVNDTMTYGFVYTTTPIGENRFRSNHSRMIWRGCHYLVTPHANILLGEKSIFGFGRNTKLYYYFHHFSSQLREIHDKASCFLAVGWWSDEVIMKRHYSIAWLKFT